MAWFTTDWFSSHHTVRCVHKSSDVTNFIIVAYRISSRLKWYKNYKNRSRLAKVIVKNKMSRFYGSVCRPIVLVLSGLMVSEGLRKSSPNVTIFFLQNFSLDSIAYIYLLVKFLFCLFFCFFHVYLLPVMMNKDVCLKSPSYFISSKSYHYGKQW